MADDPTRRLRYHHGDLRRSLLAAAELELTEKGVEGFTLRGCAKRAGVSHAAPAYHFKDADALLSELAAEGFARFTATLRSRQAGAESQDANERLVAIGLGYIDFALANPALFRLMFSSRRPDHGHEALRQAAQDAFGVLRSGVREATGRDLDTVPSSQDDIAAAWAIVHGLAELLLADRLFFLRELQTERRDETIAGIIRRAVAV